MGLNDAFSNTRSKILARDPLPTITKAYATIHQEETQRHLHIPLFPTPENSTMVVTQPYQPNFSPHAKNVHTVEKIVSRLKRDRADSGRDWGGAG